MPLKKTINCTRVLTESKQGPDEESEAFAEPKEDMHEELYGSNVISVRKSHQDIIENFKKYTSSLRIFCMNLMLFIRRTSAQPVQLQFHEILSHKPAAEFMPSFYLWLIVSTWHTYGNNFWKKSESTYFVFFNYIYGVYFILIYEGSSEKIYFGQLLKINVLNYHGYQSKLIK